jgi:hypothetical protein
VAKRLRDINMVAAAVRIAGSKLGATKKSQHVKLVSMHLRVTSAAVYKWIDQRHMRRAALETALTLSDLSGVSVRDLAGVGNHQTPHKSD